jgi:hypothetical protein
MRSTDPDVALVAKTIDSLDRQSRFTVSAYWLSLAGSRKDYAASLAPCLEARGTPILIVKERFVNANSITSDLADILEQNRPAVLDTLYKDRLDPQHISIVLLARNELAFAEGASPVVWPEWVPTVGGTEVPCLITDITRRIKVRLDENLVDVGKINRGLYVVERALIRRLMAVNEHAPTANTGLFDIIKRPNDVAWFNFLAKARSGHAGIQSSESFRPSVRLGDSVVSRLWQVARTSSARDIDSAVTGLTQALDILPCEALQGWHECLFGALGRGLHPKEEEPRKFARSMLCTISASCQYVTCAHHEGDYQEFPLNLISSVVDDLYEGLANIESCLNRMPRAGLRQGDV